MGRGTRTAHEAYRETATARGLAKALGGTCRPSPAYSFIFNGVVSSDTIASLPSDPSHPTAMAVPLAAIWSWFDGSTQDKDDSWSPEGTGGSGDTDGIAKQREGSVSRAASPAAFTSASAAAWNFLSLPMAAAGEASTRIRFMWQVLELGMEPPASISGVGLQSFSKKYPVAAAS